MDINEICIKADNEKADYYALEGLWYYTVANKYKFSLVELWFIMEHIGGYMRAIPDEVAQSYADYLLDHPKKIL